MGEDLKTRRPPKGIDNVPFVKGLINLQRDRERLLTERSRVSIDREITPTILMYSLTHNHTDREIHIYARESIPDNREMHQPRSFTRETR